MLGCLCLLVIGDYSLIYKYGTPPYIKEKMSETLQSNNSGVIVTLNPTMQNVAVQKLRNEQAKNPRLTIGDLFRDMIIKVLREGTLELSEEMERLAHKMLKERQLEKPFLTINDLYAELISEAVGVYAARQQSAEDLHSQQVFGCMH